MSKNEKWNHEGDAAGRFRGGKTAMDKKTGAWNARFANREARVAWQQDRTATNETFPGAKR